MTELERFKKLLNANIDLYQIIIANPKVKAPPMPYAVIRQLPSIEDRNLVRLRTRKDVNTISESLTRRIELYIQFDVYAKTNDDSYLIACNLKEQVYTLLRQVLNAEGFGVIENRSSNNITDRTYLEQSDFVYRHGFDIILDTKRTVVVDTPDVDTIKLKDLNYNQDIIITNIEEV